MLAALNHLVNRRLTDPHSMCACRNTTIRHRLQHDLSDFQFCQSVPQSAFSMSPELRPTVERD